MPMTTWISCWRSSHMNWRVSVSGASPIIFLLPFSYFFFLLRGVMFWIGLNNALLGYASKASFSLVKNYLGILLIANFLEGSALKLATFTLPWAPSPKTFSNLYFLAINSLVISVSRGLSLKWLSFSHSSSSHTFKWSSSPLSVITLIIGLIFNESFWFSYNLWSLL